MAVKYIKNTLLIFTALSLLSVLPVFGQRGSHEMGRGFVPEPVLLAPVTDTVDMTGKDTLEFKWSPHEGDATKRDYYDFRLYKGYEMLESTLIFKTKVSPREFSIALKADMFGDGQVYTWSLRQVYELSLKSRRVTSSFKVINKRPGK